jgi:hypothetical protein
MDKERANFCGYFEATADPTGGDAGESPEDVLRQAAEDLFKS